MRCRGDRRRPESGYTPPEMSPEERAKIREEREEKKKSRKEEGEGKEKRVRSGKRKKRRSAQVDYVNLFLVQGS